MYHHEITNALNPRHCKGSTPQIVRRSYVWGTLELRARWDAAEYDIEYRIADEDEWRVTPFNVCAAHDKPGAFRLVNRWLKSEA